MLRLAFVLLYIAIDIAYIYLSLDKYNVATKSIQGSGMIGRMLPAALAYVSLAVGWWFLVAPVAEKGTIKDAALAGFVYGVAVYGVINFTMSAMFVGWTGHIMIRDFVWGCTNATILTCLYKYFLTYK